MRRVAALWAALLVCVAVLAWLVPNRAPSHIEGVLTLDQAQFVMSDATTAPIDGWQAVALPDSWRARQPQRSGMSWYRIRFALDEVPVLPQAMYIPRLAVAGELWLNGAMLNVAPLVKPSDLHKVVVDAPRYLLLPSSTLRRGENELLIRLVGSSDVRSGLAAIRLGPAQLVRPVWQRQHLLFSVLPYGLLILLGPTLFFAYTYARHRHHYAIVLAALGAGGLTLGIDLVPGIPLSLGERHALRAAFFALLMWLLCRANQVFSDFTNVRIKRGFDVVFIATLMVIVTLVATGHASDMVWGTLLPLSVALCLGNAMVLDTAWRRRDLPLLLVGLTEIVFSVSLVQSLVVSLDWLPWESYRYSSSGTIPLCAAVLFYLARRFVEDREEAVREQRSAVSAERTRILQDMHDGFGSQLITAKRLALRPEVERQELADIIDESLQDLRLIIDSLDVAESDLLPLLGNLRFRLQPRLAALGVRLSWQAQAVTPLGALGPTRLLAILRIVQESINNALRHGRPQEVKLIVAQDGPDVLIQIIDDGQGFAPEQLARKGRGLEGMRLRAQSVGAVLTVDSAVGQGTRIGLRLRPA